MQIEIIKSILRYSMDGKVLNAKIDTAVVLVGGPETRLKPLTSVRSITLEKGLLKLGKRRCLNDQSSNH